MLTDGHMGLAGLQGAGDSLVSTIQLFVSSRDLNSGSHTFVSSALPTEPSLKPWVVFVLFVFRIKRSAKEENFKSS